MGKASLANRSIGWRFSSVSGAILWSGPSEIDGGPVVAIVTGLSPALSKNQKTGPMAQTWILRSDVAPRRAVELGLDRSICGDCGLRQGACYVTLHHGPRAVFSSYVAGAYPTIDELGFDWARHQVIRFGAYGDPAAVPAAIWFKLAAHAAGHTGYTHQWRDARFQALRFLLMASVDTPDEAWAARAAGWRTFRVRLPEDPMLPTEAQCPASIEAGRRTSCFDCMQCDGARLHDVRSNYVTIAHGSGANTYRRTRLRVL